MKLLYALIFIGIIGIADAVAPITGAPLWRHAASIASLSPANPDRPDRLLLSTADLPDTNTIKSALGEFARNVHQTSRDLVPLVDKLANMKK